MVTPRMNVVTGRLIDIFVFGLGKGPIVLAVSIGVDGSVSACPSESDEKCVLKAGKNVM